MVDTILPQWLPIWGGERFEFFRPVFNIADSAITTGVASIILFNRSFLLLIQRKQNGGHKAGHSFNAGFYITGTRINYPLIIMRLLPSR